MEKDMMSSAYPHKYVVALTLEGVQHPAMQALLQKPLPLISGGYAPAWQALATGLLEQFDGSGLEACLTFFGWQLNPDATAGTGLSMTFSRLARLTSTDGDAVMSEAVELRANNVEYLIGIGAPIARLSSDEYSTRYPRLSVVSNGELRRTIAERSIACFCRWLAPPNTAGYLLAVGGTTEELCFRYATQCIDLLTARENPFRKI